MDARCYLVKERFDLDLLFALLSLCHLHRGRLLPRPHTHRGEEGEGSMTTSALSSPSLGSASLMESPAGPFSPDPSGGSRLVVQKQVVKVKGMGTGASVLLYYKLAVPSTTITQTFQLFPDEGVILKMSQVYSINSSSKEGRIVIPPDASRHLQRAAEVLKIGRAPVSLVSTTNGTQGSHDSRGSSRTKKAKITTSNFHVSLVVPPYTERPTSQKGEDRSHFIAVVQLTVPFALIPPKWPYTVRIPLARCLNNYLYFSVDESCVQDKIAVVVHPHLLPKPSPVPGLKSKSKNESVEGEANGDADEDFTMSGPFYCTTSLCLRWAVADAGTDKDSKHTYGSGPRPVRADVLHVAAVFSRFTRINDNVAQVSVNAQLSLKGAYFPGVDETANVNLQLEASSGSCWKQETVSITPSKQSASSYQAISNTHAASASVHSLKPGIGVQSRAQQIRSPSPQSSSSVSSGEALDADATLDDEGNLLDVRPPRGIASSSLYSNSDSEDEKNTTNTLAPTKLPLAQRTPDETSIRPDSSKGNAMPGSSTTLYLALSTYALSQGDKDFNCTLEATVELPIQNLRNRSEGMKVTLPLIKANGVALEYEAIAQGATYQTSTLGKRVQRNGIDAKRCVTLPAKPSPAEIYDARLVVLADEKTDLVELPPASSQTSSPDVGSDMDDTFANKSIQGMEQGHSAQVDSLSGMIEQASVEVYSTEILQEDMLLAEGVKRKVKTTHMIRSSWPTAPAPSSSNLCGAHLPQMVFALPCSDESELQILCASVNGRSVHIEENAAGYTRSSSSRIVDLRLPVSLKEAAKIDIFLLYMQETSTFDSLCLFPPVASSIADLSISLHYGAVDSHIPDLSFSNQPVNLYDCTSELTRNKQVKAQMVPSSTSVHAQFMAKVKPIQLATAPDAGPLRRTEAGKETVRRRRISLFSMGHLFHALCTVLLAVLLILTVQTLDPIVDSLTSKVDQLALALNIDFTDGYWMPEPKPKPIVESKAIDHTLSHTPSDAASYEESIMESSGVDHLQPTLVYQASSEPRDLSVDTTSFALLMQSLSSAVTRTLAWPIHLLLAVLGRLP